MQRWIKDTTKNLTDEQLDTFEELYRATFDATPAQLRSIMTELDEVTDLPSETVDALRRVCRQGLGDAAYLVQ